MSGGQHSEERHAGFGWLVFCVMGVVTSFTLYGLALEYVTIGGKKLHETSFIFVTSSLYALTGDEPNINNYSQTNSATFMYW